MESPVRICLGALVVNLLLISSTTANGTALTNSTLATIKSDKSARFLKLNSTSWGPKNKTNIDIALNELNNKESASEEHTEKNAKYKDRGRVKFHSQIKASPEGAVKKVTTPSDAINLIIVTPTPEVKKPAEIIDSMRVFKTKMPVIATSSSTTAPISIPADVKEEEEEDYDEEEEEEDNEFDKFSTNNFHDDFFTIPGYNDADVNFNHDSEQEPSHTKQDYSSSPFDTFSSFFPNHESYKDEDSYSPDSFYGFGSELTTPKNDFFDKKYHKITSGIMKRLRSISKTSPQPNGTNVHTIVEETLTDGISGIPSNKSTVIIKNTKEIRLLDNDEAGTSNKGLSDVHGTSIYYEMSVLSTETYAIQDDDCDNDTISFEPTMSTSIEEELASIRATEATPLPILNKPKFFEDSKEEFLSTLSSRFLPFPSSASTVFNQGSTVATALNRGYSSSTQNSNKIVSSSSPFDRGISTVAPSIFSVPRSSVSVLNPIPSSIASILNSNSTVAVSTQNSFTSTEKNKLLTNVTGRNKSYSKRLHFINNKDTINNVVPKSEQPPSLNQLSRKFYYTTPKTKRVWMAPVRNVTRTMFTKPSPPTTVYSEHFNIKDRLRTKAKIKQPHKTILTTVSSEIDPVLQSDVGGENKIVYSQPISENSISSLRKRGSTRFTTTTTSAETETEVNGMEIPPTLTAWALASLISPPSLSTNSTLPQKNVDENELQKVGETIDKKETTSITTTSSPTTTTASKINNDLTSKKVTEINQKKLPWKPVTYLPQTSDSQIAPNLTETKSERLPAESIISFQSSKEPVVTTGTVHVNSTTSSSRAVERVTENSWIPVTEMQKIKEQSFETIKSERIPLVDATQSTGFESISKLPPGMTTPHDDTVFSDEENNTMTQAIFNVPTTTDYEITTIRFSYVPTLDVTERIKTAKPGNLWHPVTPTRTKLPTTNNPNKTKMPVTEVPLKTRLPTTEEVPITTYRPRYVASTTDLLEETTIIPETTPQIEVSSQLLETTTDNLLETTETTTETIDPTTTTTTTTTTTPTTLPTLATNNTTTTGPSNMSTSTSIAASFSNSSVSKKQFMTTTISPKVEVVINETTTDIEEITTRVVVEVVTEINTEKERFEILTTIAPPQDMTKKPTSEINYGQSEENSGSNEVITQDNSKLITSTKATTRKSTTITMENELETTQKTMTETTEVSKELPTQMNANILDNSTYTESSPTVDEDTTIDTTRAINELEDLTSLAEDLTTESSSIVLPEGASSGAAIAIAVSTIGVIALILLVGLLLVVRRRGRRGVYAQRCTPVSLDAYSLDSVSVGARTRKAPPRLRASKRSYGNPAYDDEVTSHPMQYAALANFALDVDSMIAEYSEIPSVSVRPEDVPPGCEDKNRFSNVLPLPETRVPLSRIGNDPTTEYINANYITGPGNIRNYYIACQAPLSNTVVDFWRMIWEQNSRVIVMLTEYMENGVEKCYEYLPPSEISDNKRTFAEYQIILKRREQKEKYAVSTIQLINLNTRTWREVTHLWYFWPAKGVPDDYNSVIDFLSEMRSYMKISQAAKEYDEDGVEVIYGDQSRSSYNNLSKFREENGSGNGVNVYSPARAEELMRRNTGTNGTLSRMKAASELEGVRPCVVVCASGAGRSASLIALDVCARALAAGQADVPRVVRELRHQRPHAINNKHQYIFLYKVLSEYGNKLMGGGVDTI